MSIARTVSVAACILASLAAFTVLQRSAEGTEGLAAKFVGKWHIAQPTAQGDGMALVTCDAPLVIEQQGPDRILEKGARAPMVLASTDRGVRWTPENPEASYSYIAEIKSSDRFWVYGARAGEPDWDHPVEYGRCADPL